MKSTVLAPLLVAVAFALPTAPVAAQGNPATISRNTCEKPEDYPGRLASDARRKAWQSSMDAYGACIKKYTADQRAIVDAAMKAGNDAVEEYNAVVAKAKDAIEKANKE
jgi:hypothetical protein